VGRLRLVALALEVGHGVAEGERCRGQTAGLECASIKTWAIIVEALANDFATLDDNTAVTVMQGGKGSLLEAKVQVLIVLHIGDVSWRCESALGICIGFWCTSEKGLHGYLSRVEFGVNCEAEYVTCLLL